MVNAEIIRRFVAQIKEKHTKINEPIIEKDFYLTLILNDISNEIKEDKESPFSKLVFKGGTLLTRAHLNYHRISEDLDFTYAENEGLAKLSSKQRNKLISGFTSFLARALYSIAGRYGLDFSQDKSNKKYCNVMDRKNVYLFRIYYSPVYGTENFIKIEVNFNDELIYPAKFNDIRHLFDDELVKDLEFIEGIKIRIKNNMLCYDLKEVACEKIRAILTRPSIKERDILDLFLISKIINVNMLKNKQIINKIISSRSFIKKLPEKIRNSIGSLKKKDYTLIEEKDKLILIEIKEKEYAGFKEEIVPVITEIGRQALLELENPGKEEYN
ncbi:nucleotidyl transferase AbiEii/AbiGii toxin family protein [Candidatus Woesearchaeota archaeon]|nr:nucleotidyl transferase AbiEii/AbiGii toxin family protein [Candidatus Woesearchaeota archaeon]